MGEGSGGAIRVFGRNALAGPEYESKDSRLVVLYGSDDRPCMIMARMSDETWLVGTCADGDWEAVKSRFGVK